LKNKNIGVFIFTALILCIKEDAVLYLICIGLYFIIQNRFSIINKKKFMIGIVLILIPLIYFVTAVLFLNKFGEGVMFWRYQNLIVYPQLGFIGISITIFQNLTYVISSMLTPAKITYILLILGSIGFLPLMQKTYREYILILPLIVMNLISNYQYQYDIRFQYHYGTGVLLLFMALLAIADMKKHFESVSNSQDHPEKRQNMK
jgi:uncharacterized membrane protein